MMGMRMRNWQRRRTLAIFEYVRIVGITFFCYNIKQRNIEIPLD